MDLPCRSCGEIILPDDRNEETMIAICPDCGAIFDFTPEYDRWQAAESRNHPPGGVEIDLADGQTSLQFNWFNWRAPVFLVAGIIVFSAPIAILNLVGGEEQRVGAIFIPALIAILGFGLWLMYYSLALFLNRTRVMIDAERVRVEHGPVPMRRSREVKMAQVQRVDHREIRRSEGYDAPVIYEVFTRYVDGTEPPLLNSLRSEERAVFIVRQIRGRLPVEDTAQPTNRVS